MAAGDDVVKTSHSNQSFVAAKVFLPETVEEAKRRNIRLISIEDVAESSAALMVNPSS